MCGRHGAAVDAAQCVCAAALVACRGLLLQQLRRAAVFDPKRPRLKSMTDVVGSKLQRAQRGLQSADGVGRRGGHGCVARAQEHKVHVRQPQSHVSRRLQKATQDGLGTGRRRCRQLAAAVALTKLAAHKERCKTATRRKEQQANLEEAARLVQGREVRPRTRCVATAKVGKHVRPGSCI